jgi:hypothetical protein
VGAPVDVLPTTGGSHTSSELNSPSSFQTVAGGRSTVTSRDTASVPPAKAVELSKSAAAAALRRNVCMLFVPCE